MSEQCQSLPCGLPAAGCPPKCGSSSSTSRRLSHFVLSSIRDPTNSRSCDPEQSLPQGIPRSTAELPHCLRRVYLFTQFASQVLPPSAENDCSDCAESSLIFQMENRIQMYLPL